MNWHLIEIRINPPDQLEFDFMNSGYAVWSAGDTEDEAMKSMIEKTGNRSDLEFTYLGSTELRK
jgi:hypothetical protein